MKSFFSALIQATAIFAISASPCFATEVSIFAINCETLRGEERKTSARIRATDIASKKAVEGVAEVFALKKHMPEHEYNIFVYDLIDNNISELTSKTTKSDDLEVCVEVSGYLNTSAIKRTEINTPEPIIEKEAILSKKPFLYIAPTNYYNDTNSSKVSEDISINFNNGENFLITQKKQLADYIIYPKVLKAQIDAINSQTNRLHMVISLDFEDTETLEKTTQHQSKFILIDTNNDEQAQAQELMKNLFKQASFAVLSKLETLAYKKTQDPNKLPELIKATN